jgi:hypothetical protein
MTEQTKLLKRPSIASVSFCEKNLEKLSVSAMGDRDHSNFLWNTILQKEFICFQIIYNVMNTILLFRKVKLISNTEIMYFS